MSRLGIFCSALKVISIGRRFDHPTLPAPTLGSVNQHWISTVAGRVGLVNDRWLVFAKARRRLGAKHCYC